MPQKRPKFDRYTGLPEVRVIKGRPPVVADPGTPDTTVPGYTPNYGSILAADPDLAQIQAQIAAGRISAAQGRKLAIQKGLISYGAVPDASSLDPTTLGYFAQDVDPLTRDLAAKNTSEGLSTVAQLQREHARAAAGLTNTLAERGMLQSGGLGVGLGQVEQAGKQAQYDAVNHLLEYLAGQSSAFAEAERNFNMQSAEAVSSATQNAIANNPSVPDEFIPGTPPTYSDTGSEDTSYTRRQLNLPKAVEAFGWNFSKQRIYYRPDTKTFEYADGRKFNAAPALQRLRGQITIWRRQGIDWRRIYNTNVYRAYVAFGGK